MAMLPSLLSERVRSNMGIIRGGVARNLSSKAINQLIIDSGQSGIRRTDLLAGIREVKGIVQSGDYVKNIRKDRRPDPAPIQRSRGLMLSEYSFDVKLESTLKSTGAKVEHWVTIRKDALPTIQDIEDGALNYWQENFTGDVETDATLDSISVEGARRR